MSHLGGRPKHRLSEHFLILDEKANSTNKAAVCKYCIDHFGFQQACLTSKVTNVVNSCLAHLRKCEIFASKYLPEEIDQILVSTAVLKKKETLKRNRPVSQEINCDNTNDSDSSQSFVTSLSSITVTNSNPSINLIRRFSDKDQYTFNMLLLRMTVSNGWAFRWVDNPETKTFFSWLSRFIQLPSRQTLSGRILKDATKEITQAQIAMAQQDSHGVTVAFDGWKNIIKQKLLGIIFITSKADVLVWDTEDISLSRERTREAIKHHEELLKKAEDQNIKILAFVTDSAAENAAARLDYIIILYIYINTYTLFIYI